MSGQDKQRYYLDANATSPPLPEVVDAVSQALHLDWGNPSSQHTEGRKARHRLNLARESVAALLGVPADWITWTSGGTEALNMAIHGILATAGNNSSAPVVIASSAEHPAVARTLDSLADRGLIKLQLAATDRLGVVNPAHLAEQLDAAGPHRVAMVAVIAAHNETGGCQDLDRLFGTCQERSIPLLLDGVQWTAKRPLPVNEPVFDAWSVSFHKFGGPKGIGALAARPGLLQQAWLTGGPQEHRRRAGTENVPGAIGAGVAAQLAIERMDTRIRNWREDLGQFRQGLETAWPDCEPIHDPAGLPQTLLVRFPGWVGSELVQRLDLDGIAVSTGSACASGTVQGSAALERMNWDQNQARELVRFSLPPDCGSDWVNPVLDALAHIRRSV